MHPPPTTFEEEQVAKGASWRPTKDNMSNMSPYYRRLAVIHYLQQLADHLTAGHVRNFRVSWDGDCRLDAFMSCERDENG